MKKLNKALAIATFASATFIAPAVKALTIQATCDGPDFCDVELSGSTFKTDTGISIEADNIIGWSMINDTSKGNGFVVKPRNEDYRFLVKYFDESGKRRLTQIGFYNWKSAQVFISSLQLLSGLAPNHDQTGAPTHCTYNGKSFYSGTVLNDRAITDNPLLREKSLALGALVGAAIGSWFNNPAESFGNITAPAAGAFGGLLITEGLIHKSGNFMLEKNIMSAVRSTPAKSSRFLDGSFKHLEACKDAPKYTPFPLSIEQK